MKKSIMQKWVKALRSGKFKQTSAVLKGDNGYCCLGVLCAISKKGKFEYSSYDNKYRYLNETGVLPHEVQEWSGMKTANGDYWGGSDLVTDNDNGRNFKWIADKIEKHWERL